jgi:hypothetical protein
MRAFLAERGYRYGRSTIEKLCGYGEGPPVWKYQGRRPLYLFDEALEWAERRLIEPPCSRGSPAPMTAAEDHPRATDVPAKRSAR